MCDFGFSVIGVEMLLNCVINDWKGGSNETSMEVIEKYKRANGILRVVRAGYCRILLVMARTHFFFEKLMEIRVSRELTAVIKFEMAESSASLSQRTTLGYCTKYRWIQYYLKFGPTKRFEMPHSDRDI